MSDELNPYAAPATLVGETEPGYNSSLSLSVSPTVRSALAGAWVLASRHFTLILVVVTVVWLPAELVSSYLDYHVFEPDDLRSSLLVGSLFETFIGAIATAAVISIGAMAAAGGVPTFGSSMVASLRCWLSFWLTGVLTGILVVAGLVFFLIPGIYVAIRMALVDNIIVVERTSGAAAIRRSFELTQGRFWFMTRLCVACVFLSIFLFLAISIPIILCPFDHWLLDAASTFLVDLLATYFTLCFYCAYRSLAAESRSTADQQP